MASRRPSVLRLGEGSNEWNIGIAVRNEVLQPLEIAADETWFTDVIPWFFIKGSVSPGRRAQADVIEQIYAPIAEELGLPECDLPARPPESDVIKQGVTAQRQRLRDEMTASNAPLVITLGEEARRVLLGISDEALGTPTKKLSTNDDYGRYIPFDPEAAALFFSLISSRYERSSLIVSSNKTFSAWPEIFGDAVAVAAMVDRLVHHADDDPHPRRPQPQVS